MHKRNLWLERLQQAWTRRSIIWLSGVRRVGKTTLARMLPDAVYMNCDLPSTLRALEDPELFLDGQAPGAVLVFDEVHRLEDPSRLLKIAADEYPLLRSPAKITCTSCLSFVPSSALRKGLHANEYAPLSAS
jgi:predicted AAA+ superfamily ATPase